MAVRGLIRVCVSSEWSGKWRREVKVNFLCGKNCVLFLDYLHFCIVSALSANSQPFSASFQPVFSHSEKKCSPCVSSPGAGLYESREKRLGWPLFHYPSLSPFILWKTQTLAPLINSLFFPFFSLCVGFPAYLVHEWVFMCTYLFEYGSVIAAL